MILFQCVGIPLFALFLWTLHGADSDEWKRQGALFLRGTIAIVPALILYYLLRTSIVPSYAFGRIFLYALLMDHLVFYFALCVGFLLLGRPTEAGGSVFVQICLFAAGFYTLASVHSALSSYGKADSYVLFYLPFLRMITLMLFALVVEKIIAGYGLLRIGYGLVVAALPVATAGITFLYLVHRALLSAVAALALAAVSVALWVIAKE